MIPYSHPHIYIPCDPFLGFMHRGIEVSIGDNHDCSTFGGFSDYGYGV